MILLIGVGEELMDNAGGAEIENRYVGILPHPDDHGDTFTDAVNAIGPVEPDLDCGAGAGGT